MGKGKAQRREKMKMVIYWIFKNWDNKTDLKQNGIKMLEESAKRN